MRSASPRSVCRCTCIESGPEDGVPVVLLHGNLSTGRFFEHLFDGAPGALPAARARHARVRGHRARADRRHARAARLGRRHRGAAATRWGSTAPPHLVGWSTGGAAIAAFAMDRPVASLTFIDPVGPYGYGGDELDGTPHFDDFAGSGGGTGNPEFTARLAAGDTSRRGRHRAAQRDEHAPTGASGTASRPSARTCSLGEILKSVTGDDGYPGDTAPSEHWPGVAPGTRGILNALSPKYCNWAGIVDLDAEAADPVDARRAGHRRRRRLAVGAGDARLARRGAGLAGRGGLPAAADGGADPRGARAVRGARGARARCECFEGSGHFPPIDARERWSARLLRLPGVR